MAHTNFPSPSEQLASAIRQLPHAEKLKLWQILDTDLFHRDVDQELDAALKQAWLANPGVMEDEAMADALQAIREFRNETTHRS